MTVTQYIGARYVPLFDGEWDITKQYEPLTVVLYQGNSYTSMQAVPTGISISNTEYWAATGSYNAQVEAYRQEVLNYDSRITANATAISTEQTARVNADADLADDIATNSADIATNAADIATNATNIATNTADIATNATAISTEEAARIAADNALGARIDNINVLTNPYDYFKNYNAVFIGDSYAYGTGASDHLSGDTKRFTSILCSLLQANEFNFAVGSTGFCDPGSGGQNAPFPTQVSNAIAGMTNQQIADTHLVVIAGGVNDFNEGSTYGYSDMRAACATACARAESGFPNAWIVVVPMLFKGAGANPRLLNFEDALVAGANGDNTHYRTVVIRGAWTWNFGMASHFNNDALHPNDVGHKLIAARIYERILGGYSYENRLQSPTFENGYSGGVDQGTYFEFMNGVAQSFGMYITGSVEADTTTKIASVPGIAPNQTVYGIVCKSGSQVGVWQITPSGAIYVRCNTATSDFYLSPISYIPKGVLA